ncbi:hypothetical protein QZH41_010824 [Actinostola sp. cb2023]|nr:hypothetical protein QZH41_010824 [Actinostola sp. cb2023]
MCLIFKNIEISREDIEEYMKQFAEDNMMKQPHRSLIGNMYGEKILLATPLLKWYLEHGLEVTQVYQVVEFTPEPCFSSFGVAVSNAHRAGDVDPSKAIANTMKLTGVCFGVVECDVRVPESLKEKFSEMCPIFKNIEISRKDIEEYMKQFAEDNDMMKQPSRSLIGNMYGEKILLATPLLKWYLEHGLEVTQVYQVVEFTPEPCFSSFGVAVSNAHRAGDVDPSKAIANTMKLVSFGIEHTIIMYSCIN